MVLGNSQAYSSRQQKAFERKTKWQELEAVGDIRSRGGNALLCLALFLYLYAVWDLNPGNNSAMHSLAGFPHAMGQFPTDVPTADMI